MPPPELRICDQSHVIVDMADIRSRLPLSPVRKLRAQKFVAGLLEGKTIKDAAAAVGSKPRLMQKDIDVQAAVADLLARYTLPADTRKNLSRAITNQAMLDPEADWKDRLKAVQIANEDSEVGISSGPQVALQQNFQLSPSTASLLQGFSLDPEEKSAIISPDATPILIEGDGQQAENN